MGDISIKIADGSGEAATVQAHAIDGQENATMTDLINAVKSWSAGAVLAGSYAVDAADALFVGEVADPYSNIEERMAIGLRSASGFLTRITIPAVANLVFTAGTDEATAATRAQIQALIDDVSLSDNRGSPITTLVYAKKSWTRTRK